MLFQLKQDVDYLKEVVAKAGAGIHASASIAAPEQPLQTEAGKEWNTPSEVQSDEDPEEQEYRSDSPDLSIKTANNELIERVLHKHNGNRKAAAAELGISERTLYRKKKQFNIE